MTMNVAHRDPAYEITWLVRRLFRAMAAKADAYLETSGLSAAERAVMEFLYPDRQLSVPEIAARYTVSRQHVQVTVNGLLDKGLLRRETNPQHKRSPLFRLSAKGVEQFARIRSDEEDILEQLFVDIEPAAIDATRTTLRELLNRLQ
jgi:DNA-binding MarR family transcriptional regulator